VPKLLASVVESYLPIVILLLPILFLVPNLAKKINGDSLIVRIVGIVWKFEPKFNLTVLVLNCTNIYYVPIFTLNK